MQFDWLCNECCSSTSTIYYGHQTLTLVNGWRCQTSDTEQTRPFLSMQILVSHQYTIDHFTKEKLMLVLEPVTLHLYL